MMDVEEMIHAQPADAVVLSLCGNYPVADTRGRHRPGRVRAPPSRAGSPVAAGPRTGTPDRTFADVPSEAGEPARGQRMIVPLIMSGRVADFSRPFDRAGNIRAGEPDAFGGRPPAPG